MMRGQKLKSHQEKVSAEKPEVRGICLLPDSSDVWSWGSNRVKEAPPPQKGPNSAMTPNVAEFQLR